MRCKNIFPCRFCTYKYHPFDPEVQAKYVVGDDYLPTWKVPSLATYYNEFGFGMKGSFDAWLRAQDTYFKMNNFQTLIDVIT